MPSLLRLAAVVIVLLLGTSLTEPPANAVIVSTVTSVGLGAAGSFSVLAGSMITNAGSTVLSGDIGVSPGTSISGFPPGVYGGALHAGDPVAAQAQADLSLAYDDAAGRAPTAEFAGDNNGRTYTPGVYHSAAAFALTGEMILDAEGDPGAVFIFQIDAALNTAAGSTVSLVNGAQASRVFWQVAGATGTGASSSFAGTILSNGSITIGAGATVQGHALSRDAVTLAGNTLTAVTGAPKIAITGGPTASTNNTSPVIEGTTDAASGTVVTVLLNGRTLTTETRPDGTWTTTAPLLAEGTYALTAAVTNQAGHTGTTTQTLTIEGGSLSITVPKIPVDLGSNAGAGEGETISSALGQVQVIDTRSSSASTGWVVSVISTDFISPAGSSIPAESVSYIVGPVTKVGAVAYESANPLTLTKNSPALTATQRSGGVSATWNPLIKITIPGQSLSGVYSAVITHSVL